MKKERGLIAPIWLYAAGAIAFVAALTGLVIAGNRYTSRLDRAGYERGVAETTAAFEKRDNAQLQAALAAQKAAEVVAAQAEQAALKAQSTASGRYRKGLEDGQKETTRLVAAARAGDLRLRDPGAGSGAVTACPPATGSAAAAAGATGGDGPARGELSEAATGFLLALAGEADDVARQLGAAQAVILSDRVLCNGQ